MSSTDAGAEGSVTRQCLDLRERVVLITGAGRPRGLGYAMARALLSAGARVVVTGIDGAAAARDALEAECGTRQVAELSVDVTDPAQADQAVSATVERFGQLDMLINNAGVDIGRLGMGDLETPFWAVPASAWARITAVNYLGAVSMTSAAVKYMLPRNDGRIVSVTTSLHTMWRAQNPSYGASKAAHEAFISSAALTLAGTGVSANVLVPGGTTDTDLVVPGRQIDRDALLKPLVMGPPVVWLASDEAVGTNGIRIVASRWDERLPLDQRLRRAGAPVAWPQLGRNPVWSVAAAEAPA